MRGLLARKQLTGMKLAEQTTMPTLSTLPTPSTTGCAARIEWTGERIADLCDGTLDMSYAPMLVAYLLGWMDLCTADERRQYNELARRVSELREAA